MNTKILRICCLIILIISVAGINTQSWAATINASSCAQSAVQTAINSANNGDTVVIPAGNCTWSTAVSLNVSSKNLNLQGAGVASTIITAGTAPMLKISGAQGYQWILSNLTINASASGQEVVNVSGTSKNWRVHHLNLTNGGTPLFWFTISGETYGLVDHLNVSGGNSSVINIINDGFPIWTKPAYSNWGDEKAIFFEDNTVTLSDYNQGRFTIDCQHGGRYVMRYNKITNQRTGNHGLDSGGHASCLSSEIYNNSFNYTSNWSAIDAVIYWRGGTMLLHDNTFTYSSNTWITNHMRLPNFRGGDGTVGWPACNGTQYKFNASVPSDLTGTVSFSTSGSQKVCSGNRMRLCTSDSTCSANGEGMCSENVDGTVGSGAYPCFQQVGRGVNNMLNPVYEWNNTFSGGNGSTACGSTKCDADFIPGAYIQENRDYYNDTQKPGYTAYTYPHPLQAGSTTGGQPPATIIDPPKYLQVN